MSAADELEIRNLLARLAQLADSGGVDDYVALMTDDVVWEMPANPAVGVAAARRQGRDEVAAGVRERHAAGVQGPGSDTLHTLNTTVVAIDGDRATADSYFLFFGDVSRHPVLRSIGRYHDELRRIDGAWRLAHRTIALG